MSATTSIPSTVAALLKCLDPFCPTIKNGELVFATDPPEELDLLLGVLHTGIRAALTRKAWYGCGADQRTAAPRVLDPSRRIPAGITLLCVEGDDRWDRLDPTARRDLTELFAR